jgi:hypothetical protein
LDERAGPLDALRSALAAQVNRGGRGSDLAAAELRGIRAAELASADRNHFTETGTNRPQKTGS